MDMDTGKILTQAQAEAVYRAMVELNNVIGCVHARLPHSLLGRSVHVQEGPGGAVQCWLGGSYGRGEVEDYPSQDAFAQAYGLTTAADHHE